MRCLVGELADSTALYRAGNHAALFHRLHEDGYVCVLHPVLDGLNQPSFTHVFCS